MEVSARARKALLTTAGVLAALVLVAVAARGSTPAGDERTRAPGDTLLDVLFTLYISALVGGAILFVYLLALQRRVRVEAGQVRRRSLLELVATLFMLVIVGTLVARRLLEWRVVPEPPPDEPLIRPGGGLPTGTTTSPETTSYEPGFSWIPAVATAALIVLAVVGWWLAGRARRRARGELGGFELTTAVARAVDESLWSLYAEPDPRRAVIAAYARLEHVLAAHGLPRRPAEAPLEYLARMLTELEVSEGSARALTELFERAKFSQHAVGPEMKERAIAALESVRDELLAARERAERAHAEALAARTARAAGR